jgi:hypothetical protein
MHYYVHISIFIFLEQKNITDVADAAWTSFCTSASPTLLVGALSSEALLWCASNVSHYVPATLVIVSLCASNISHSVIMCQQH